MTRTLPTETCEGRKDVIDVFLFYFELQKMSATCYELTFTRAWKDIIDIGAIYCQWALF